MMKDMYVAVSTFKHRVSSIRRNSSKTSDKTKRTSIGFSVPNDPFFYDTNSIASKNSLPRRSKSVDSYNSFATNSRPNSKDKSNLDYNNLNPTSNLKCEPLQIVTSTQVNSNIDINDLHDDKKWSLSTVSKSMSRGNSIKKVSPSKTHIPQKIVPVESPNPFEMDTVEQVTEISREKYRSPKFSVNKSDWKRASFRLKRNNTEKVKEVSQPSISFSRSLPFKRSKSRSKKEGKSRIFGLTTPSELENSQDEDQLNLGGNLIASDSIRKSISPYSLKKTQEIQTKSIVSRNRGTNSSIFTIDAGRSRSNSSDSRDTRLSNASTYSTNNKSSIVYLSNTNHHLVQPSNTLSVRGRSFRDTLRPSIIAEENSLLSSNVSSRKNDEVKPVIRKIDSSRDPSNESLSSTIAKPIYSLRRRKVNKPSMTPQTSRLQYFKRQATLAARRAHNSSKKSNSRDDSQCAQCPKYKNATGISLQIQQWKTVAEFENDEQMKFLVFSELKNISTILLLLALLSIIVSVGDIQLTNESRKANVQYAYDFLTPQCWPEAKAILTPEDILVGALQLFNVSANSSTGQTILFYCVSLYSRFTI